MEGDKMQETPFKKSEVKKLRECFANLDEQTVLQKLDQYYEVRDDRNCVADMVILKENNVLLRKKVDELKTELQSKEQVNAKLRELLNVKSLEAREAPTAIKKLQDERRQRSQSEAKVMLLERQLEDMRKQLHEEKQLTARSAEGIVMTLSRQPASHVEPQAAAVSCIAALASAVTTFHIVNTEERPSASQLAPQLTAAALALTALSAATTTQGLPHTSARGTNTDPIVTQHLFVPQISELPHGQELLRTIYDRDSEIRILRRDVTAVAEMEAGYKKTVERLTKQTEKKTRELSDYKTTTEEWNVNQQTKVEALQNRITSLRGMLTAVCQDLVTARRGQGDRDQRSLPVAIPGTMGPKGGESTGVSTERRQTATTVTPPYANANTVESPSKCSVGSDSEEPPYIEGHSGSHSDKSHKPQKLKRGDAYHTEYSITYDGESQPLPKFYVRDPASGESVCISIESEDTTYAEFYKLATSRLGLEDKAFDVTYDEGKVLPSTNESFKGSDKFTQGFLFEIKHLS